MRCVGLILLGLRGFGTQASVLFFNANAHSSKRFNHGYAAVVHENLIKRAFADFVCFLLGLLGRLVGEKIRRYERKLTHPSHTYRL